MKEVTTIKLSKKTVELLNRLKIHPRQPYEEVVFELANEKLKWAKIKDFRTRSKINRFLTKGKRLSKKGNIDIGSVVSFIAIISILSAVLLWGHSNIFGFVTLSNITEYEDILNLEINKNDVYNWTPKNQGTLKSIKLSGSLKENGTAKVWVEKDNHRYLIFDYDLLNSNPVVPLCL